MCTVSFNMYMCILPEMMRYALTNQFLNKFFSFFPVIIPVSYYMTPKGPRIFFAIGWVVASGCSIAVSSAAPRRHRYLRCIGTFPAVIALERIQRLCIGFDQPGINKLMNYDFYLHSSAKNNVQIYRDRYFIHKLLNLTRVFKTN